MVFLIQIVVAIVLALLAYAMTPKPKQPKPDTAKSLESPTSDAGKPVGVVFGTVTIKDPNCLWFGDVSTEIQRVKV